MNRIAAALLAGALTLSPGIAIAEEGAPSLEQLVVEMANTPEQHAALARYYRSKADEARAEMRRHETMERAYGGRKLRESQRMKDHCQSLAKKYAEIAEEYDALAKLQEGEAK